MLYLSDEKMFYGIFCACPLIKSFKLHVSIYVSDYVDVLAESQCKLSELSLSASPIHDEAVASLVLYLRKA